jgi:methionyl-tRNA formyltransferase
MLLRTCHSSCRISSSRAVRAILLGSGAPAVTALETLLRSGTDVVGVGAHATERSDGIGKSLLTTAAASGLSVAEFSLGTRNLIHKFVRDRRPNVGFTVGFRYLLDAPTLAVPPLGWLNIHSSLLPTYRGRAPINWAILNGETELGATLHFLDEGVDTGDMVLQERFPFSEDEDVADALAKLDGVYASLIERAISGLNSDGLTRTPLGGDEITVWPRRTADDGKIDWRGGLTNVLRLVRAVAPPYPGAFTTVGGTRLFIYKARARGTSTSGRAPGSIISDREIVCRDGNLEPLVMALAGRDGRVEALESLTKYVGAICE